MSWQATAYIFELAITPTGDTLTRSEKLLALLLANRHRSNEGMACPSAPELAVEARLSERRTRYLLHSLAHKGVITIEHRWIGHQRSDTNVYRFPGLAPRGGA